MIRSIWGICVWPMRCSGSWTLTGLCFCLPISRPISRNGRILPPGISYTYDTVTFMQELWPDAEIYLIIGEDSLTQLYTWYRVPDLLRLVHFVAAERPGYEGEFGVARLTKAYGAWVAEKIIHAEVPHTAISSTEIRKRLREEKPIRGMTPLAVEEYIHKHGLYRAEK